MSGARRGGARAAGGGARSVDWGAVGDLVCALLGQAHSGRAALEAEAARRGIGVDRLLAAAITQAVRECVEGTTNRGTGPDP